MRALLLSDDPDETALLLFVLQRGGLNVKRQADIERAVQTWAEQPADLVVMALDSGDVLTNVHLLRAQTEAPLLVITDPIKERDAVALLDAGVDLLAQRPYSAPLLAAQTRALMRRAVGAPLSTLPTLNVGDVALDPAARTVQIAEQPSKRLTQLEFRLLYTLMVHRDQILAPDILVEYVWGYAGEGDRDLVRGLVSRLRAKVETDPRNPRYIVTVPGVGYSFSYDE